MQGKQLRLALLPLLMLVLASLACGGFQVRTTPVPASTPKALATVPAATATNVASTSTVEPVAAAQPPTQTPEPTKASPPTGGLAPGARARISVDMVNVRSEARSTGGKVGTLANGTVVTVKEGPVNADNYSWYKVDNGSGVVGWVASGPSDAPWLKPESGGAAAAATPSGPKLVNRSPKVGDLVQVTTEQDQLLTVRENAGRNAAAVAKVKPGTQFTIKGGPTQQDNLTWWQIEGEQIKGWAAEGDGQTRWLTPLE